MALFRGIGYILLGSGSINIFPDSFLNFGIDTVGDTPVPWTIVPFLVLAPIFAIVLQKMPLGTAHLCHRRQARTPRAIPASGWHGPSSACSSPLASSARQPAWSMLRALPTPAPTTRSGIELDVITIALLGGISVFGGKGKPDRRALGAAPGCDHPQRARPAADRRRRTGHRHRPAAHRLAAGQQCGRADLFAASGPSYFNERQASRFRSLACSIHPNRNLGGGNQ